MNINNIISQLDSLRPNGYVLSIAQLIEQSLTQEYRLFWEIDNIIYYVIPIYGYDDTNKVAICNASPSADDLIRQINQYIEVTKSEEVRVKVLKKEKTIEKLGEVIQYHYPDTIIRNSCWGWSPIKFGRSIYFNCHGNNIRISDHTNHSARFYSASLIIENDLTFHNVIDNRVFSYNDVFKAILKKNFGQLIK